MAPAHHTSYGSFLVSFSRPARSSSSLFVVEALDRTLLAQDQRSKITWGARAREHPDFLSVPFLSTPILCYLDHFSLELSTLFFVTNVTNFRRETTVSTRTFVRPSNDERERTRCVEGRKTRNKVHQVGQT